MHGYHPVVGAEVDCEHERGLEETPHRHRKRAETTKSRMDADTGVLLVTHRRMCTRARMAGKISSSSSGRAAHAGIKLLKDAFLVANASGKV